MVSEASGFFSIVVLNWMAGLPQWLSIGLTMLITFIEAVLLVSLMINHRMNKEVNLFAGVIFCLLMCALPAFLPPSPVLFANFFLILAMYSIFNISKSSSNTPNIFNTGFWLGLGSLFYLPLAVFYFWGIIGMGIMQSNRFRHYLILLAGILVPFILTATWHIWFDNFPAFLQVHFVDNVALLSLFTPTQAVEWIALVLFGLLILMSLLSGGLYKQKKSIAVHKKINILYYTFLFTILCGLVQANLGWDHIMLLFPALAILIAINFTYMSNQWAEVSHLLALLAILLLHYRPVLGF